MSRIRVLTLMPFFLFSANWAIATEGGEPKHIWPMVSPLHSIFSVSNTNPHVETIVFGGNGEKLYRLSCHNDQFETDADGDFNFLYQCKLFPLNPKEAALDLFYPTEKWDRSRTRAAFARGQIAGLCKEHAFYGRDRRFNFRGMVIRLRILNFEEQVSVSNLLQEKEASRHRFKLFVDIDNDAKANISHASVVPELCEAGWLFDKSRTVKEEKMLTADPAWEMEHSK
jgi:hypothetical protein